VNVSIVWPIIKSDIHTVSMDTLMHIHINGDPGNSQKFNLNYKKIVVVVLM